MKKMFFAMVVAFAFCASAASKPPKGDNVLSWIEPYTKCKNIIATSGIWSGDTFTVYEVRTKTAGMLRVKLDDDTSYVNLHTTTYDVLRIKITAIDLDSCTADTIMVFGYPK